MLESVFYEVYYKETPTQVLSGEICELLRTPILYFNECLWKFQIFFSGQYIPVWYTPTNHEQCIFIVHDSADRKKTKQFSTTI